MHLYIKDSKLQPVFDKAYHEMSLQCTDTVMDVYHTIYYLYEGDPKAKDMVEKFYQNAGELLDDFHEKFGDILAELHREIHESDINMSVYVSNDEVENFVKIDRKRT